MDKVAEQHISVKCYKCSHIGVVHILFKVATCAIIKRTSQHSVAVVYSCFIHSIHRMLSGGYNHYVNACEGMIPKGKYAVLYVLLLTSTSSFMVLQID